MASNNNRPIIYRYLDYRLYLRDLIDYKRAHDGVFSNRYIVKKAGYSSPTALKHVIDGKRNLSDEAAEKFSTALGLSAIEREYFRRLVGFNQAPLLPERERLYTRLLLMRAQHLPSRIHEEQYDVLAEWWHLAIREIVMLSDFKKSSKWIAKALTPSITPRQAALSLKLLKKRGLLKKEKGKWVQSNPVMATDPQVRSIIAANYHRRMMTLGKEAIDRFKENDREISGTTLRIAGKDISALRGTIRTFRKQLLLFAKQSRN
ncbi:MAG: TIGR02147 family protein, partial [Chitinivibrionales bacterium]|nr:TIGR02147 family protein [Chitinivibrionales bacterium]